MIQYLIRVSVMVFFVAGGVLGVAKTAGDSDGKKDVLGLQRYLQQAMRNNASLAALRLGYRQGIPQAGRVTAIRDLMLAASLNYTLADLPMNNGVPQNVSNLKGFSAQVSLSKRFPELLGMTAGLSLAWNRTTYDSSLGSGEASVPNVALQLTVPLLQNALGRIDRNTLKSAALAINVLEAAEQEAVENFVQSLITAYLDWSLLSAKTEIYRGISARAQGLYGQTLQKRTVGMADWSDVHLVHANYLRYRSLFIATGLQAEQQYLNVLSLMQGGKPDRNTPISVAHSPEQVTNAVRLDGVAPDRLRTVLIGSLQYRQAVLDQYSAVNGMRPDLKLVLNAGRSGYGADAAAALGDFTKNQLYAGLEFSVSLQNTDRRLAAQAATTGMKKASRELEAIRRSTEYTLKNLRHSIRRMRQMLEVSRQMAEANRLRLGAMYGKYTQGRVALSQVTDARDAYATARISYLEQQTSLEKLHLGYLALTDRLLQRYSIPLQQGKKQAQFRK